MPVEEAGLLPPAAECPVCGDGQRGLIGIVQRDPRVCLLRCARCGGASVDRMPRDDVLARALSEAFKELADAQGDQPGQWRWGRMHTLTLRDATFGASGIGPIEALFNRGPVATAGGSDIVNATSWDAAAGYEVTVSPSMRMIVDLSNLDASRWVQMTGNSGHAYHQHYADQLELWRTGGMITWRWEESTIASEASHTLTLRP